MLIDIQGHPKRTLKIHTPCIHVRLLEGGMGQHGLLAAGMF